MGNLQKRKIIGDGCVELVGGRGRRFRQIDPGIHEVREYDAADCRDGTDKPQRGTCLGLVGISAQYHYQQE